VACSDECAYCASSHVSPRRGCPGIPQVGADEHDSAFVGEIDEAEGWVDEILRGAVKGAAGVHFGTSGKCHLGSDLEMKHLNGEV